MSERGGVCVSAFNSAFEVVCFLLSVRGCEFVCLCGCWRCSRWWCVLFSVALQLGGGMRSVVYIVALCALVGTRMHTQDQRDEQHNTATTPSP